MDGKIKTLLKDKNCGFIRSAAGKDYFFYCTSLKNCEYTDLTVGDEVTFEDAEGSRGPRAEDVYLS